MYDADNLAGAAAGLRASLAAPVTYQGRSEPRFDVRVQSGVPQREERLARHIVLVSWLDAGDGLDALVQRTFPPSDLARLRQRGAGFSVYTDVWARGQVVALVAASTRSGLDSLLLTLSTEVAVTLERAVVARWSEALRQEHASWPDGGHQVGEVAFTLGVPATYRQGDPPTRWEGAMRWVRDSPTRVVTLFWLGGVDSTQARSRAFLRGLQRDALWRLHEDTLVEEESDFESVGSEGEAIFVGVWQNEREVAGGPLVTRFIYAPTARRLFAIQGLLFAPGRAKHAFVRELRALLHSFVLEEPT